MTALEGSAHADRLGRSLPADKLLLNLLLTSP